LKSDCANKDAKIRLLDVCREIDKEDVNNTDEEIRLLEGCLEIDKENVIKLNATLEELKTQITGLQAEKAVLIAKVSNLEIMYHQISS